MAIRRNFFFSFPLALLLVMVGCTDSPTGGNDDDDGNDTNQVGDDSNLAPDGAEFIVEIFLDYENPAFDDKIDTTTVRVATDPSDYAGRSNVHHYQMFAGFVTDKTFRGSVVERENGDLEIYHIGNLQSGTDFWWFYGWIDYPINGAAVLDVIHDSTNASGTRRQQVTWKAEPGGSESITVGGKTYGGKLVYWEMKLVRWVNGSIEEVFHYYGEDIWVPELAFAAERYIELEVDGELAWTSLTTLIDYTIPVD